MARSGRPLLSARAFLCLCIGVLGSADAFTSTIRSPLSTTPVAVSHTRQHHDHCQEKAGRQHRLVSLYAEDSDESSAESSDDDGRRKFQHTLAILSMPSTSTDKIANEAILNQAVHNTHKLSVVLRAQGRNPSLSSLRKYVGEVYSSLWDVAMSSTGNPDFFCDVVVYPQNLPNAAPEQWINHAPDLDSVCSHDSIVGWVSESAYGRGLQFQKQQGDGFGGLDSHVKALNADRAQRKLRSVQAIHVEPWPLGASTQRQEESHVMFLDDEESETSQVEGRSFEPDQNECEVESFLGGAQIASQCLFEKVAVGGTFDGMHYGHRKLLTLAVSSVSPSTGSLMIGVTVDDMLKHKSYAEYIPKLKERMEGAKEFVYRLAPGIKNRVRVVPISDEYGPPGQLDDGADFDALVLSHETLENGCKLNEHRENTLGLSPLTLLCTRRTEPHGMSSTALRRRRYEQVQLQKKKQAASKAKI